jgi:dynein heavy chain, axonemal
VSFFLVLFGTSLKKRFSLFILLCRVPQALPELFAPLLHGLLLAWRHCPPLRSVARLAGVLRCLCCDLVAQARRFVPGRDLFHMDPSEAVDRLKTALRVLGGFKGAYAARRAETSAAALGGSWEAGGPAVFSGLDAETSRWHEALEVLEGASTLAKLDRVELGGVNGKMLASSIREVQAEAEAMLGTLRSALCDILDPVDPGGQPLLFSWRAFFTAAQSRLAAAAASAIDEAPSAGAASRALDALGPAATMEGVASRLERKHVEMVRAFVQELRCVAEAFAAKKAAPPMAEGTPVFSGAVSWVRGLGDRISGPMEKLRALPAAVLESEDGREMERAYASVAGALKKWVVSYDVESRYGVLAYCMANSSFLLSQFPFSLLFPFSSEAKNSHFVFLSSVSVSKKNYDPQTRSLAIRRMVRPGGRGPGAGPVAPAPDSGAPPCWCPLCGS